MNTADPTDMLFIGPTPRSSYNAGAEARREENRLRRRYQDRLRADWRAAGDRLHLLGVDSYEAYLRGEHWAAVRRLYRASERLQACFVCGDENFDLHHRTYTRLGRERLDDLCPLCRPCHEAAHELEGVSIGNAPEVLKARTTS